MFSFLTLSVCGRWRIVLHVLYPDVVPVISLSSSGRLALAPGAPLQPTGDPQAAGASFAKASRQLASAAADSDLTSSEDKSMDDSFQVRGLRGPQSAGPGAGGRHAPGRIM